MAANNDNAMTRFLFAILKQKCLKDIDWNKVAHDPILIQEITNGHAARMRYSRFRSGMLGLEPQKRNRNNAPKSKVTKSKKEAKAKKEEAVKPDPTAEPGSLRDLPAAVSPKVKQKAFHAQLESQPTPASVTAAPLSDAHVHIHPRLLTPCSETDLLVPAQGYTASPAGEMLHTEPSFDFAAASGHCSHEHGSWPHTPYQEFGMPYELDSYAAGFCEHQHTHHHAGELCLPSAIMDPDPGNAVVKHEEWDAQYHSVQ